MANCVHDVARSLTALIASCASMVQAQGVGNRIQVPSSVPGLTTQRLLVMSYIDGLQARNHCFIASVLLTCCASFSTSLLLACRIPTQPPARFHAGSRRLSTERQNQKPVRNSVLLIANLPHRIVIFLIMLYSPCRR